MGMTSHPRSKTLVIWIVLISVLYLVASCGDDRDETGTVAEVAVKAPQSQQPVIKEWYPRPKYPPPLSVYAPSPGPPAADMGQPQPGYPGTYQPPQMTGQTSSPWYQDGQPQDISRQYQIEPQYQSQSRPWGEFPPLEKKKKTTTLQEQRPDTIPYGGWPGYGGYGYYGYGLGDPYLGAPGLGGGMYGIYPQIAPPLYGW